MQLTQGRLFALQQLEMRQSTGRDIARAAQSAGLNTKKVGADEWADAHLRWLREVGLAELTGTRNLAARVHRITDAGERELALRRWPDSTVRSVSSRILPQSN